MEHVERTAKDNARRLTAVITADGRGGRELVVERGRRS
jgi:hypothetical protein